MMRRLLTLAAAVRRGSAPGGLPYKLTLILTRRCPTKCDFCSIWKTPSPDEMTPAEWDRVFASVPGTVWANLSGGEIFQRADVGEIVDALVRRMPRLYLVDFPTTGYFVERTIDTCRRLVAAGVRKVLVTVSLDGPPALHDRLRGREGAHAQACAALRALREARLPRTRAYFGMTLFPENHTTVDETVAAARAMVPGTTASDFHFNIGMESGHYYRNLERGARPPVEVLATLARYGRRGVGPVAMLERAYQRRVRTYLDTGRSPVPCAALRASAFVDPQGVVYPCSIYDRPLGGLREHDYDLARILRGPEATDARAAVVAERCPGCWTPCEASPSILTKHFGPASS
jgi:MoaA/NifB/PqqE/SkfB family radical SAM enzyme